MVYTTLFLGFLVATAIAMALTVWSGRRARRSAHVARALTTVGLLGFTVWFAWLMSVHERLLPVREMRIHRVFSITVAVTVPCVAATGILLWRNPRWRGWHRAFVAVLVTATVAALGTGIWVLSLSSAR